MRTRSLIVALLGLAAALVMTVPGASAQSGCPATATNPYPPTAPSLQLGSTQVVAGSQIVISGTCFTPNRTVALELRPGGVSLGSAQSDAVGSFSRSVTIPASTTPGAYTIVASDGRFEQSVAVTVLAASVAATTDGALPRTGASFTIPFGIGGVSLIGVGTAAVLAARRKRAAA